MTSSVNDFYLKEPVGKLILKFAVPSITALLVSSLYNIVDQIFIGNGVGYLGNAATNVVYPITIIAQAIALLIGDGCAAYLSICQGRKDSENAQKSVGNALTLMIISAAAVFLFFFLTRNSILWLFGATENNIGYTKDYFAYILLGMPFFMLGGALPCIIRADGSPRFAMAATLAGCVINVILDPIAIFVLDMGVKGAAIATALGQIVSAVMCIWYLFHARSFRLTKSDLVLKASVLKKMLPLGISSFLTQISIMVNMTVMNNVLVKYGAMSQYGADIPLSVVGIVQKVFGIMIAVTVGIAAGSQPIVGYNYGAREYGRVKKLYKTMMIAEAIVGLVTTVLVECFPLQLVRLFGEQEPLYNEYAVLAFRVYFSASILCCVQKSTSIFMQALGKPALSMGLSLLRDFVLCVLLALLLPIKLGVYGPLLSAPISDVLSMAAVIGVMLYLKKLLNRTPTEETA